MTTSIVGSTTGMKAVTLPQFDQFLDHLANGKDGTDPKSLYAAVAWTFWCVNLRADAVASIPYKIYTADSDEDTEENEVTGGFDIDLTEHLWRAEAWLNLGGAAYWLKRENRVKIRKLQVLNPTSMSIEEYDADGPSLFKQVVGGKQKFYPADKIVYFHTFDPRDDWGPGVAPGEVGELPGQLIRSANAWAVKFFDNGAVPAVMLTTDQAITPDVSDRITRTWNKALQGAANWFKTIVLGHGLKADIIQPPVKDLIFEGLESTKREQILGAHKIPPGLAEAKTNRAERDALQFEFWTQCIKPEVLVWIAPAIDEQLLNPLGYRIGFQFNEIEAIQAAELKKAEAASFMVNGVMIPAYQENTVSIDEVRAVISSILGMASLPQLEDSFTPEDRTPEPIGGFGDDNTLGQAQPRAATAQAEAGNMPPKALVDDLDKWRRMATKRIKEGNASKALEFDSDNIPEALAECIKGVIQSDGAEAFSFLKAGELSRAQAERRLEREWIALMGEYQAGILDDIEAGREPDTDELDAAVLAALLVLLARVATEQALRESVRLGVTFDVGTIHAHAAKWAREYGYDLVKGLNNTTRKVLQEAFTAYHEAPGAMTRAQLTELIEPAFGKVRAEMISSTEITRAYSEATNEMQRLMADQGVKTQRVWVTAEDERVCIECGPLHNKPEAVWAAKYPSGPPAHVRCRCGVELREVRG